MWGVFLSKLVSSAPVLDLGCAIGMCYSNELNRPTKVLFLSPKPDSDNNVNGSRFCPAGFFSSVRLLSFQRVVTLTVICGEVVRCCCNRDLLDTARPRLMFSSWLSFLQLRRLPKILQPSSLLASAEMRPSASGERESAILLTNFSKIIIYCWFLLKQVPLQHKKFMFTHLFNFAQHQI